MFEIQIGDKITLPSTIFKDIVFLTGRVGQGKSTTFLKVAIDVIKNGGAGLILDPYGDLAKSIKDHIKSQQVADRVVYGSFELSQSDLKKHLKAGKMVIVYGRMMKDGERKARENGIKFLKKFFKVVAEKSAPKDLWFLIDEAFTFLDDEIYKEYLKVKKMKLNVMFCDNQLSKLSEKEREQFCKMVPNYLIYKTMNYDGLCLERNCSPFLKARDIAAIRQYHFQVLLGDQLRYDRGKWPIEGI